MHPSNLAFMTSPMQVMNLRQFCVDRGIGKDSFTLIVKRSKKDTSARALDKELGQDFDEWGEVLFLNSSSKFLQLSRIVKGLKHRQWGVVVTGELTSWWQNIVASNLTFAERVLVDDGTKTIFDYHLFMQGSLGYQKSKNTKNMLLRLVNVRTRLKELWPITVFSIFPLPSNDYVRYERNSLSILKGEVDQGEEKGGHEAGDRNAFLGQPFVDDGFMKQDEYIGIVRQYMKEVPGDYYYFPHRSEGERVLRALDGIDGLTVMSYLEPVEKVIGRDAGQYRSIAGISTTSLFTLHILFPELPIYFYPAGFMSTATDEMRKSVDIIGTYLQRQANTCPLGHIQKACER